MCMLACVKLLANEAGKPTREGGSPLGFTHGEMSSLVSLQDFPLFCLEFVIGQETGIAQVSK